jgi:predicted transcriptional regulator
MSLLWRGESLSATQLLDAMPAADIGLSTVQSTLERLHRKGMVSREKAARAFVYRHNIEREELIRILLRDITQDIAGGDLLPVISGFARYVADDDTATASAIAALRGRDASAGDDD